MKHMFTYGSLMYESIWNKVTGSECESLPALISGYERMGVINADYPVLVPRYGAEDLRGVVYFNVTEEVFEILDRYEGEFYQRVAVPVALENTGNFIKAETYILKPRYSYICDCDEWDKEYFESLRKVSR